MAGNNKYENDDDTPNLALVITSGHDHDAYAVFKSGQYNHLFQYQQPFLTW